MLRHLFQLMMGLLVLLTLLLSGLNSMSGELSLATATPTTSIHSLFEDDTCVPPCWFGLISGESAIDDIAAMFHTNNDIFIVDPDQHGNLLTPNYDALSRGESFGTIWLNWNRADHFVTENWHVLEDGVLKWMRIVMNDGVSLEAAIDSLGQPAFVRSQIEMYLVTLQLHYPDLQIVVRLSADLESCHIKNIYRDFNVFYVYYYPEGEYEALEVEMGLDYALDVSDDLWQSWLSGELSQTCEKAFAELYRSAGATATQAAVLLATPLPTPTARNTQMP